MYVSTLVYVQFVVRSTYMDALADVDEGEARKGSPPPPPPPPPGQGKLVRQGSNARCKKRIGRSGRAGFGAWRWSGAAWPGVPGYDSTTVRGSRGSQKSTLLVDGRRCASTGRAVVADCTPVSAAIGFDSFTAKQSKAKQSKAKQRDDGTQPNEATAGRLRFCCLRTVETGETFSNVF